MSNIALQVERQAGGVVAVGENIIFESTIYTSGNIAYNTTTGIITFLESGRYILNWWIATQSSASSTGAVFALSSSNGDFLEGNSPVKTGEVTGGGIIEVTTPPVTVSLVNASNASVYYAPVVLVKATLLVFEIDIAGPIGPTGPTGPTGQTGPLAPQSFVQLFDRNYTNELTANGALNLSNAGVNPLYTTGGYTLTTTTVTNDTLNLPGPGLYNIEISLRESFLLPLTPPAFGSTYQVLFSVLNEADTNIINLVYNGIIPNDPNATMDNQLLTQFLYNTASIAPSFQIVLSNFDFSLAFDNQLSVFDIIIIVQKWESP